MTALLTFSVVIFILGLFNWWRLTRDAHACPGGCPNQHYHEINGSIDSVALGLALGIASGVILCLN